MSTRLVRALTATGITAALCVVSAGTASAHNAGHFFLPSGSCQEVGSFRPAPLVGPEGARTPLDLVPETPAVPFDEYGASFVGFHGNTPIFPGGCPR